jgi:hypothetical protein
MQDVTLVTRQGLTSINTQTKVGSIKQFYKGFKPTWQDLIEGVPAILQQYAALTDTFVRDVANGVRLFPILGAAGSGKSTFLKWLALKLSDDGHRVYFADNSARDFSDIIIALESSNKNSLVYILFDRMDVVKRDILFAMAKAPNAVLISTESQTIWANRLSSEFSNYKKLVMREISEDDVQPILEKLQNFGPWTRLSNMSQQMRKRELFDRSKRQLLIGLMETTIGVGFEDIIIRDFASIENRIDKTFFVVICIATMHRAALSESVAARTLSLLGLSDSPQNACGRLDGLVEERRDGYVARHPVYARKIVESVVSKNLIFDAATALLKAFSVYPHPVVKSLDRNDATLFKSLFNHRFLNGVLRVEGEVLHFYSQFEKTFENDGLFWLQYGLALRSFNRQSEAYDVLQTAYNAYPHDHTIHAFAQQKMVLASSDLIQESVARTYLSDAIKLLASLDDTIDSDDTYPIVTLAEGHVQVVRALDGSASARIKAKEYVDILESRLKKGTNPRLEEARNSLFSFAATGQFKEK